jgi:hypothetical protein
MIGGTHVGFSPETLWLRQNTVLLRPNVLFGVVAVGLRLGFSIATTLTFLTCATIFPIPVQAGSSRVLNLR